jgi:hypothetical protein
MAASQGASKMIMEIGNGLPTEIVCTLDGLSRTELFSLSFFDLSDGLQDVK